VMRLRAIRSGRPLGLVGPKLDGVTIARYEVVKVIAFYHVSTIEMYLVLFILCSQNM
jgi:hypothetical protein